MNSTRAPLLGQAAAIALCFLGSMHLCHGQAPATGGQTPPDSKALLDSFVWKEIPAKDLEIDALDVQEGMLFFRVDGHRLYFSPKSDDATTRSIALTSIMSELRHAKTLVISYSTLPERPGSRHFPFYAPRSLMETGGAYDSVAAFYFKY